MYIRRATIADVNRLLDLERYFSTDRLNRRNLCRLLRWGNAEIWVCEDLKAVNGDIAVLYRQGSRRARIYSLAVDPEHRRRGIARALVAAAEKGALARGCDTTRLEVRCDNSAALRLYEQCGYRVVARTEHFYEDRAPALKMEKTITSRRLSPRRPALGRACRSDAAETF